MCLTKYHFRFGTSQCNHQCWKIKNYMKSKNLLCCFTFILQASDVNVVVVGLLGSVHWFNYVCDIEFRVFSPLLFHEHTVIKREEGGQQGVQGARFLIAWCFMYRNRSPVTAVWLFVCLPVLLLAMSIYCTLCSRY